MSSLMMKIDLENIDKQPITQEKGDRKTLKMGPEIFLNPEKLLDGYFVLKSSGCELPNEVVRVTARGLGLVGVNRSELLYFVNVRELFLDDNSLSLQDVAVFPNLRRLSMMNNHIEQIFFRANHLDRLEILDLSLNSLKNPEALCKLTRLRSLSLSNTEMSKLPWDFCLFQDMETLDLSFNRLSDTSCSDLWRIIATMSSLRTLNLSHNRIRRVHETPEVMKSLKTSKIDLSFNLLTEVIDVASLSQAQHLQEMVLSNNKLVNFSAELTKLFDSPHQVRLVFISFQTVQHLKQRSKPGIDYRGISLQTIAPFRPTFPKQEVLGGILPKLTAQRLANELQEPMNDSQKMTKSNVYSEEIAEQDLRKSPRKNTTSRFPIKKEKEDGDYFFITGPRSSEDKMNTDIGFSMIRSSKLPKSDTLIPNQELLKEARAFLEGHTVFKRHDKSNCYKLLNTYFT